MGRRRKFPKHKQTRPKWYQTENDWGDFVFNWSLGLSGETWREIFAIINIIIAAIVILGFFNAAGSFGEGAATLTRKWFGGLGSYLFAGVYLYFGIKLFIPPSDKKDGFKIAHFVGLVLMVISIPSLLHLFIAPEFAKELARFGHGGGLVGYTISNFIRGSIGVIPAFLVVLALIGISILMTFNISISKIFHRKESDSDDEDGVRVHSDENKISVFESVRRKLGSMRGESSSNRVEVIEPAPMVSPSSVIGSKSFPAWQYPSLDLLKSSDDKATPGNIYKNAELIQKCLESYGIQVSVGEVNIGPTVTQYTIKPKDGVKLTNIVSRQNDLALALSAKSLRIEAPIPGKNLVGIEIPNKVAAKVTLKEVMKANEFKAVKSKLAIALGRDVSGEAVAIDLEKMPHLLIAGSTGSGKSVCINTIITALLFNNSPQDLKILLVDPKRVELTNYNKIPHLLTEVVTEVDKTVSALKWAVWEMERRYKVFEEMGKRNIIAYNSSPGPDGRMPYIIIIIDELADLMATSAKDVEASIVRLAQMARATGIHLVIATQRPSVDVLTGLIKANITSRVAFATASQVDSRTILDISGAEKLLGNGDMLFLGNGLNRPRRLQGCFVSDGEIDDLVTYLQEHGDAEYDPAILSFKSARSGNSPTGNGSDEDELYDEAIETVMQAGKASASLLQRRLKVGYARAARLLDIMQETGVVGPADGAKPRDVYSSNSGSFGSNSGSSGNNGQYQPKYRDENFDRGYRQDN